MAQPGVYVANLGEVRRWFRTFEPDLVPVLRNNLKSAVERTTVPRIRGKVPQRSGAAASSVRAVSGGNTLYVKAGSSKVPYFGWLDFGGTLKPTGKRRNTQHRPKATAGRYVYPGVKESEGELANAVLDALDRMIRNHR